jgi:hypothetical protein
MSGQLLICSWGIGRSVTENVVLHAVDYVDTLIDIADSRPGSAQ